MFAVVFTCCSVRMLFCSTVRSCCVRCFVRMPIVVFAVLFALCRFVVLYVPCSAVAVLFDVLFASESERSVRCLLNGERLVRMFAFVFGERFVVFAGWIFLTGVRCSHNGVRSQS